MFADLVYPVMGFKPPSDDVEGLIAKLTENIGIFEKKFLAGAEGDVFAVGNTLSIADYKVAPLLYYLNTPAVNQKTGFSLVCLRFSILGYHLTQMFAPGCVMYWLDHTGHILLRIPGQL